MAQVRAVKTSRAAYAPSEQSALTAAAVRKSKSENTAMTCALWPHRMGTNPRRAGSRKSVAFDKNPPFPAKDAQLESLISPPSF
jgi:hypothetical protein